ncbi:unnamed protein product [Schistosoma rodhaini]|uniref:Uncharacterized protein n=1 Tax=Schistosoma rodhaini TaxID=6188 RepID=A0AA85FJE5_9TREM|nr:unnamed protein product [Schistosoma rodhaini]
MRRLKFFLPYCVITLGSSFPFGYHTGVINAPADLIKSFINTTLAARSVTCDERFIDLLWSLCVTVTARDYLSLTFLRHFLLFNLGIFLSLLPNYYRVHFMLLLCDFSSISCHNILVVISVPNIAFENQVVRLLNKLYHVLSTT